MIKLPCSCGKKGCPNEIVVYEDEARVWIQHELAQGGPYLIYSTKDRLHTFANKLSKATGADHERQKERYRIALEAILHSGDPGTFEHRTAAKALRKSIEGKDGK